MRKTPLLFIPALLLLFLLLLTGEFKVKNKIKEQNQTQNLLYHLSSEVSPNGFYRLDSFSGDYDDRYNYYQIFVTNLKTDDKKKIYSSDFRTTDWKWMSNNKVKITYNCGTGCRATKVMSIDETILLSDDIDRGVNQKNGWKIDFFKSF